MKLEQIQSVDITDKGGMFDIMKQHHKFQYNGKEWSYIATGLVREVFRSDCGNFVIKIPKANYGFNHNILEYEVYRDAPNWCKDYIAVTKLTKDNYVIQEYLKINPDCGNYFRELGVRGTDNKTIIFDCDIFLDHNMKKPKLGFKYQQVFSKSSAFGSANTRAKELPRELRLKQKEAVKKYFPSIEKQEFRSNGDDEIFIDGILVPFEIANECGFTMDSGLGYD